MNKKMKEILQAIQDKLAEAKQFTEGENKNAEKAAAIMTEVQELKNQYEVEKAAFLLEKEMNGPTTEQIEETKPENKNTEKKLAFLKAIKSGDFSQYAKDFSEGSKEDGGYTVPEDISYKVEELRDAKASLLDEVTVVPVTTNTGRRTFKKRSQQTGFAEVGEGGKITKKDTPQFEILEYAIRKFAGYFVVTNEVLEDSVENLEALIEEWMANESRVTANVEITKKLKTFTKVALDPDNPIDSIKEILNVKLGQAFKPTSKIITNDDGLNYLDTLKDSEGRYLLSPNPSEPMKYTLAAGATSVKVSVYPNADMPTEEGAIPFFIGDLKEGINFFDRKKRTILPSNTAAVGDFNAYEQDLTVFRAIEREDIKVRDEEAVYFATLTKTA
jgi:HK97 family phage major capsid protein